MKIPSLRLGLRNNEVQYRTTRKDVEAVTSMLGEDVMVVIVSEHIS